MTNALWQIYVQWEEDFTRKERITAEDLKFCRQSFFSVKITHPGSKATSKPPPHCNYMWAVLQELKYRSALLHYRIQVERVCSVYTVKPPMIKKVCRMQSRNYLDMKFSGGVVIKKTKNKKCYFGKAAFGWSKFPASHRKMYLFILKCIFSQSSVMFPYKLWLPSYQCEPRNSIFNNQKASKLVLILPFKKKKAT